ncbi:hypothetical protein [Bradyrhizobium lablabi]|nr:hypothetical protein [Bradyrhizobium lablabi]
MRRVTFSILAALMLVTPARAAEVLSWQGVGPVQLGMTVHAAERALGKKLAPRDLAFTSDECYVTGRADKVDPGITYVIENGKITVISVFRSDGQTPDVLDKHRAGIGSTEEDIRSAYGQVKKARGFYDRGEPPENDPAYVPEFWIEADSPDSKRTILFITQAGKITSMTTGLKPMVLEAEPCH